MGETNTTAFGPQNQRTEPSIAVRIHEAIAAHDGLDPNNFPPLYDSIDPDALDSLFAPTQVGTERDGTVTFEYGEYQVTVTSEQTVTLEPLATDNT